MYLYSLDKCHPINNSYVNDAQESEERLLCLFNRCIVANSSNYSNENSRMIWHMFFFLRERRIQFELQAEVGFPLPTENSSFSSFISFFSLTTAATVKFSCRGTRRRCSFQGTKVFFVTICVTFQDVEQTPQQYHAT